MAALSGLRRKKRKFQKNLRSQLRDAAFKLLKKHIMLREGEHVVLVTDRKRCEIADAFRHVLKQLHIHFDEVRIDPHRLSSSPIPQAKRAFRKSNVIIAPTTKSISHSPETREARYKYGTRVASMPGITPELFIKAMKADINKIRAVHEKLHRALKNVKSVHIISPSGTDLVIDMRGKKFMYEDNGDLSREGILNNIPFGEICAWIDKADGVVAIDVWKDKITSNMGAKIFVKNGTIVWWNKEAEVYVKNQMKAGVCGLKIVELGIGTNPSHKNPIGIVLHDEKIYGSVHIAFGGGGTRKCPIHQDVVMLKPTLYAGNKLIIKDGRFLSMSF
jgi:leucyl aminopeptidase (aminopeptidase T)